MHNIATPLAIDSFKELLQRPETRIYLDTCFGASDNRISAGLSFLLSLKNNIIESGKRIYIIHYVAAELNKKAARKERWAINTNKFICDNLEMFAIMKKSSIEEDIDAESYRNFADEALRRLAIADESQGRIPVLLTADHACALATHTNAHSACTFVLDRVTADEALVRTVDDFLNRHKFFYINYKLPHIFSHADIILTGSALRSKEFSMLVEILNLAAIRGQKLPVFILQQTLNNAVGLPDSFRDLLPKVHIVRDDAYGDETASLKAFYAARNEGRNVMLVGSNMMLTQLHKELENSRNFHLKQRSDNILYYRIGPLGSLFRVAHLIPTTRRFAECDFTEVNEATSVAEQAAAQILQAAQQGDVEAMGVLSAMYMHGLFVKKSTAMARIWKDKHIALKKLNTATPRVSRTWLSTLRYHICNCVANVNYRITRTILTQS